MGRKSKKTKALPLQELNDSALEDLPVTQEPIDPDFSVDYPEEDPIDPDFGVNYPEEDIDPNFGVDHPVYPEIPMTPLEPPMPEPEPYKVYAIHENKLVREFYSTCFQDYQEGSVLFKEGFGDEFTHTGSYLIYDENFCHNYRIGKGIKEVEHPVLDDEGNHVYEEVPREIEVEVEVPKVDDEGNPIMEEIEVDVWVEKKVPVMDDCGHQHVDENGEPVFNIIKVLEKEKRQVPVMVTVKQTQTVYDKVYQYTTEYVEIDVVIESTPEQKAEELASKPAPPLTSVQKLENDVQFIQEDVNVLFMGIDETNRASVFNTEDIAFVANAIFELDEKIQTLMPEEQVSKLSDKLLARKGVSLMAEMWARWIQTGRKTFDQVPTYLQAEVRILLADVGITV